MNTIKKLPFLLAFAVTLFVSACGEVEITPGNTDPTKDPYAPPPPPPPPPSGSSSSTTSIDSLSFN